MESRTQDPKGYNLIMLKKMESLSCNIDFCVCSAIPKTRKRTSVPTFPKKTSVPTFFCSKKVGTETKSTLNGHQL